MEVRIITEYIKLDQLIKLSGLVQTGGIVKHLISEGMVKVNGAYEWQRGKKIRPGDRVEIEEKDESGRILEIYQIDVIMDQEA